jgi:hypothetical protein
LDVWLTQRVDEIVGQSKTALPLFQGLSETRQTPRERLMEFIAQAAKTSGERNEANTVLHLFQNRIEKINGRGLIIPATISNLGAAMLFAGST